MGYRTKMACVASKLAGVFWTRAFGAVDGAFMTLPPYSRSREGEVHELGLGVRNCPHTARSRPISETSESIEWAGEGTSAEGTARCASRGGEERGQETGISLHSWREAYACKVDIDAF